MLLETRLEDGSLLFIDAPSSGGFSKDSNNQDWHPDKALDHIVRVATSIGMRFAAAAVAAAESNPAPETLELTFGVKVDGAAVVSVGKSPEEAQFRVTARWTPSRRS